MFTMMETSTLGQTLSQNPNEQVELLVRNFNTPTNGGEYGPTVGMRIESLKVDFSGVDLQVILPPTLVEEMIRESDHEGKITAWVFIDFGRQIAAAMKRSVTICHQHGSGNQEEASYHYYGPFLP